MLENDGRCKKDGRYFSYGLTWSTCATFNCLEWFWIYFFDIF